jgi:D-alanyl-D-alanine carboxypeptidase/D-alanyl-D-alanine-endopeptidase (penicillin-binding protein 4)
MPARALCLAAWLLAAGALQAQALPPEVETLLQREGIGADALAIVVQEVGPRELPAPRLVWRERVPVNPASLAKLVTTQAALELLGPAWAWRTPVWISGTPDANGVLDGAVHIRGTGDPKLTHERLWLLLKRLREFGIREIRGDFVLDQSAFEPPDRSPADFDNEPLRPYNTGAEALLLNQKAVIYRFTPDPQRGIAAVGAEPALAGVRVDASVPLSDAPCETNWRAALRAEIADAKRVRFAGSYPLACGERTWPVAYPEPRAYAARLLPALWRETGGRLVGRVREGAAPRDRLPAFEWHSPPLPEVLRDINKHSNNVMAQQLFLTLGLVHGGRGAPDAARAVMTRWLAERLPGEPLEALVIDNGSGLSRSGRLTAALLARLLHAGWAAPTMPELMSSLPMSGLDGTLRRSAASAGRAHLKTGSLRDVAGVAGYVLGASGRRYVLVAIVNHANASAARPALDALVQWAIADER